jgi:phosphogluconate dehydratase
MIEINTADGSLQLLVSEQELAERINANTDIAAHQIGMGREMFAGMRSTLTGAEQGACSLFVEQGEP